MLAKCFVQYLLVQCGEEHDDEIPDEEDDTVLSVHFPAVHVRDDDETDDGGEQGDGGVQQA